jgi:hypothetical protein
MTINGKCEEVKISRQMNKVYFLICNNEITDLEEIHEELPPNGHTIAQAVSSWFSAAKARV